MILHKSEMKRGILWFLYWTFICWLLLFTFETNAIADSVRIEVDDSNDQNINKESETWIERKIQEMSVEEKVAQMFIITPEALTGVEQVIRAGDTTQASIEKYPVGGLIYFADNIISKEQVTEMLSKTQYYSIQKNQIPIFTCIDEEGGSVTRISGRGIIDVPDIDSMMNIGRGTDEDAYNVGEIIGEYLYELGFNVDFAPVADVVTNPDNTVIGERSFGDNPKKVSEMVKKMIEGMHDKKLATTLKHFPGHGNTVEDSHYSSATSYKTIEELKECEMLPFSKGIEAGTDLIMIGHISLPNILGDYLPASLSDTIITGILRGEMGFRGVVITDAMNMAAISNYYSSSDAAVQAIKAGNDIILMPYDFESAYKGVLQAIENNEISIKRIDESLRRILALKYKMMSTRNYWSLVSENK